MGSSSSKLWMRVTNRQDEKSNPHPGSTVSVDNSSLAIRPSPNPNPYDQPLPPPRGHRSRICAASVETRDQQIPDFPNSHSLPIRKKFQSLSMESLSGQNITNGPIAPPRDQKIPAFPNTLPLPLRSKLLSLSNESLLGQNRPTSPPPPIPARDNPTEIRSKALTGRP